MAEAAKKELDPVVAQDLAQLALSLSHDKKTRKAFGKLVKEARPDTPHAAAFADIEIEDKFEAFTRAQEEKELKAQQQRVLDRMNQQRQRLLDGDDSGRKYSEDDIKKIEALMEKKGIVDYEDAKILYSATLPPQNQRPERDVPKPSATWDMPEIGKFMNPAASRDIAFQVIDEFQRKAGR
jgi:hypothetical protein